MILEESASTMVDEESRGLREHTMKNNCGTSSIFLFRRPRRVKEPRRSENVSAQTCHLSNRRTRLTCFPTSVEWYADDIGLRSSVSQEQFWPKSGTHSYHSTRRPVPAYTFIHITVRTNRENVRV